MEDPLNLKEKLKDPEYNNWVKAVLILMELKVGISSFVEVRCKEAQEDVIQKVQKNLPPLTAVPQCTTCTRKSLQRKKDCPQNICPVILQEINKIHRNRHIQLSCTDVSAWTDTSRSWELAKTFIMGDGYSDARSAADTDCAGLLSIIINCVLIDNYLTENMSRPLTVFHKVKKLRNKVMHSPDSRLSVALLQDLIKACVQILDDPKTLAADKTAKDARERIKEIEGMLLTVSNVDYQFLLEVQENQRQEISEIKTNVAVLAGKQASQDKTMTDLAGKQAAQDTTISDLAGRQASQDKNMTDLAGKQAAQDTKQAAQDTKQAAQDTKISDLAGKQASEDKNMTDLAGKQAAQDTNISDLAGKQASHDKRISDLARQQALQGNELQGPTELKLDRPEGYQTDFKILYSSALFSPIIIREDLENQFSESEIKEALEWFIKRQDLRIVTLILDYICRLIQASEEDEVVDVWPGYRVDSPWKPIFVLLTRTKYFGELDTFMGYPLYKRRYDFVSFEAAKVISSELVLENLLSVEDMSKVRNAVASASLHKVHSNITIINGCPCRSRHDGDEIQKEMCVVVHCRVKGIIPFAEQPFPRELSGIPVDVREAYFMLGMMNPRTVSPSSSGGQDGDVSHKNLPGCSASSSSEELGLNGDVTMEDAEHTGPGGDAKMSVYQQVSTFPIYTRPGCSASSSSEELGLNGDVTMEDAEQTGPGGDAKMSVYQENASIISRRSDITLEQGSTSKQFNPSLLIGSGIGPAGLNIRGSIGGFIPLKDGSIGAITCAHLFCQSREGNLVTQPADGDVLPAKPSTQSVFGELVKKVFKGGSKDSPGVDAALVKITSRMPKSGEFVLCREEQITFAGFELSSPPNFQEGNILKIQDLSRKDRQTTLLKVGSQTGLTKGVLYLDGTDVWLTDQEGKLPNGDKVTFYKSLEVCSIMNVIHFFDLGDSGSLVFMPLNGSDLHCIGLAVGCTSYHTCIVTPIDRVFKELELPLKFINFLEHSNTN